MGSRARKTEVEKLVKDKQTYLSKRNFKEVATICNYLGSILTEDERYEEAIAEHEMELDMCRKTGDTLGIAIANRKIGECFCSLEKYDDAVKFQERHLKLSRELKNTVEEQRAQATLGRTYLCKASAEDGDRIALKKAKVAFESALQLALNLKGEEKPDAREFSVMVGRLYLNLGLVSELAGKMKDAVDYCNRARTYLRGPGLAEDEEKCLSTFAALAQKAGDLVDAEEAANAAYKLAKKHMTKDPADFIECLYMRAGILMERKKFTEARHCMKRVLQMKHVDESQRLKAGKIIRGIGRIRTALQNLARDCPDDEKLKLFEKLGDEYCAAECYISGLTYYKEMLRVAEGIGSSGPVLAGIYVSLAQTCADLKLYRDAISYALKETKLRTDHGELCRTWLNIADYAYHCEDDQDFVMELYNNALSEAEKSCSRRLILQCLRTQLSVFTSFKEFEKKEQIQERISDMGGSAESPEREEVNDDIETLSERSGSPEPEVSSCTDSDDDGDTATSSSLQKRTGLKVRRNEKGETQLHVAVINGNFKLVKRLIEKGHPVNERDAAGWLPIHEAANHNHLDIAAYLLEHNADINDLGNGKERNDMPPIIDAAHSGNLEMVRLLWKQGADISLRDGNGWTVVGALFNWKKENYPNGFPSKEAPIEDAFQSLTAELQSAMIALGMRPDQIRAAVASRSSREASQRSSQQQRTANRAKKGPFEMSRMNSLDENEYVEDGVKNYQEAMNALRESAKSRNPQQSVRKDSTSKSRSSSSALIPSGEFIGDDWLQDDSISTSVTLTSSTKTDRARAAEESPSSSRNNNRRPSGDLFNRRTSSTNLLQGRSQENDDYRSERDSSAHKRKRSVLEEEDDEIQVLSHKVNSYSRTPSGRISPPSPVTSSMDFPERFNSYENFPDPLPPPPPPPVQQPVTIPQPSHVPQTTRRIKIRIGSFLIVVPLGSNLDRTIGWLIEEAALRYQRECENLKPNLQLRTSDGAILFSADKIVDVVGENEQIIGVPLSWNVPPIAERYRESAKTLRYPVYENVINLLNRAADTGVLSAANLNLCEASFVPIARALIHEVNLRELHLEANSIGDGGLSNLLEVLPKLPRLSVLNLCCTEITSTGLRSIYQTIESRKNEPEKFLRLLADLDLSYNLFTEADVDVLFLILSQLPGLVSVKLAESGFSSDALSRIALEFTRIKVHSSRSTSKSNPFS